MLFWQTAKRYYALTVRRNLFGAIEIVTWWGGRGSRLGHMRSLPAADWREALAVVRAIAKRRQQHGYRRVKSH